MTDFITMPVQDLLAASARATDLKQRTRIWEAIQTRTMRAQTIEDKEALWPSRDMRGREEFAGLYPDPQDPQFASRLYQKKEFFEARAVAAGVADGSIDPCNSSAAEAVFELTPVQRIVSRFMHPMTPYSGLLLYHGVGVGKTCSAVTIAENFLLANPFQKAFIISPQALTENFKNTVFDTTKLVWSEELKQWKIRQCTGSSYLERLNLLDEPDRRTVEYRIAEDIRKRYSITGYQKFANIITEIFKKHIPVDLVDPDERRGIEDEILRKMFSNKMIIIDEAHNLRDLSEADTSDTPATAVGPDTAAGGEAADNKGGKAINPYLKRIVLNAEGLKLVLMTATPMYNSAPEIVLLLNLLTMNDSKLEKSAISIESVFTKEGDLNGSKTQIRLEKAARAYVSYMRGENPFTFPLRLKPLNLGEESPLSLWPNTSATRLPVTFTEEEARAMNVLPIKLVVPIEGSAIEMQLRSATTRGFDGRGTEDADAEADAEAPLVDKMLDTRMQMANITYPNGSYGIDGFNSHFRSQTEHAAGKKIRTFTFNDTSGSDITIDSIFKGEGLKAHAPKIFEIVENIKRSRGICFVYSRYIKAGALPLAIALELIGFQRRLGDGKIASLLKGVTVDPICAICGLTNGSHTPATDHKFSPACYVMLTSEEELTPNMPSIVREATTWSKEDVYGPRGSKIKVIIGSQVASEGLDLKCIREVHILDSWYHLNRIDQIIGRAIRFCSHTALPVEERNCLIYMYAVLIKETQHGQALETADMYAYRIAISKAQKIGRVQRLLKRHAWDCNLELEAITFAGLPKRRIIDAQGNVIDEYDINDQDYTTYCDYQVCKSECKVAVNPSDPDFHIDNSTFKIEDARKIIIQKQKLVRGLFEHQIMVPETQVQEIFSDLPWEIASDALLELLDGKLFHLTRPDGVNGFLVKKAGYLVFQPAKIKDTDIPIALRYARGFQLLRKSLNDAAPVWRRGIPSLAPVALNPFDERIPGVTATQPGPTATQPQPGVPGVTATQPQPGVTATQPEPGVPGVTMEEAPAELLIRWNEWSTFVESFATVAPFTALFSDSNIMLFRIWGWILPRFKSVDAIRLVAYQWWVDKILTFEEQRQLIEASILETDPTIEKYEILKSVFTGNVYITDKNKGYLIFNPVKSDVECYTMKKRESGNYFTIQEGLMKTLCIKTLFPKKVEIPRDTGILVGFMAGKSSERIVFKTLDTTAGITSKTRGAECEIVSGLAEHHKRLKIIHDSIKSYSDELISVILEDENPELVSKKSKVIEHVKHLTKGDICIYMECLTRLMDIQRVNERRWFLNAITAKMAGLKST